MQSITLTATPIISLSHSATVRLELVQAEPLADLSVQAMTIELLEPGQRAWFWMVPDAAEGPIVELTARRSALRSRIRSWGAQPGRAVMGRLHHTRDGRLVLHTADETDGVAEALATWIDTHAPAWPILRCLRDAAITTA